MAIPAGLSAFFHGAWIVILLVWAGATHSWPGHCGSHEGAQYAAMFGAFLLTSALKLVVDLLLVWHSLRGAPFEAHKRRWVEPLLYASTAPLLLQLGLSGEQSGEVGECWSPLGILGGACRVASSSVTEPTLSSPPHVRRAAAWPHCLRAWGAYESTHLVPNCAPLDRRHAGRVMGFMRQ